LGQRETIESLEIRWPSGITQKFEGRAANQFIQVIEGEREWRKVK
jgi:hypothetical protein